MRLASRMLSAISFGVFWRWAPSTSAIMRSMKVSPGFEVISTTMRSDSTLVPPVTALRSPPDSRITGADSPVMADSSTDATPSTTSPSPGITSFASTTTRSPGSARCRARLPRCHRRSRRRAMVSVRVARRAAACALPRPSATASARLANTHREPEPHRDETGEHRRVAERTAGSSAPNRSPPRTSRGCATSPAGRACGTHRAGNATAGRGRTSRTVLPRSGPARAPGST